MESSTALQGLSFRQNLREGQRKALEAATPDATQLNLKLPTGYGKTFTFCCIYALLQHAGRCNRVLYIVANTAQLNQFLNDISSDLHKAGVSGPRRVVDVSYAGERALKEHRRNDCQIFAITVQALRERRGMALVADLLGNGQWLVVVDEYHHYGIDKSWGRAVLGLNRAFLLAMSATPHRRDDDSAFGPPTIAVSYREAKEEGAVKHLKGHAYNYRIDIHNGEGTYTLTTKELFEEVGSDDPDKIEKFRIERKMRWSPDYISPLVSIPIERMLRERVVTGHRLQVLVEAFCVSHAKMVCEQVRSMFPELNVQWVGTGDEGRPDEQNERILKEFCPPKAEDGVRPESNVDVLVQVGIAGEGVDCVCVSEVIHLNNARICNKRAQIQGRAARYLPGVIGHINFDASSELAEKGYVGDKIMDAMDFEPPRPGEDDEPPKEPGDNDLPDLPDEPEIRIFNMELESIDSGAEGVQTMARAIQEHDPHRLDFEGMGVGGEINHDHPDWEFIINVYRGMRAREAVEHNDKAVIEQWKQQVNSATGAAAKRATELMTTKGEPFSRKLLGQVKHTINKRKKAQIGNIENDLEVLKAHYKWVAQLDRELKQGGLPGWLVRR